MLGCPILRSLIAKGGKVSRGPIQKFIRVIFARGRLKGQRPVPIPAWGAAPGLRRGDTQRAESPLYHLPTNRHYIWIVQPSSASFSSISASASSSADRRCGLEVRSDRTRSRCSSSACRCRLRSADSALACAGSGCGAAACDCCSSTDLLSHPRDIILILRRQPLEQIRF